MKEYQNEKLKIGERSGVKCSAKDVTKEMKSVRVGNQKKFARSEWLTESQISGYFSRLAAASKLVLVSSDNDEIESAEETIMRNDIMKSVMSGLN